MSQQNNNFPNVPNNPFQNMANIPFQNMSNIPFQNMANLFMQNIQATQNMQAMPNMHEMQNIDTKERERFIYCLARLKNSNSLSLYLEIFDKGFSIEQRDKYFYNNCLTENLCKLFYNMFKKKFEKQNETNFDKDSNITDVFGEEDDECCYEKYLLFKINFVNDYIELKSSLRIDELKKDFGDFGIKVANDLQNYCNFSDKFSNNDMGKTILMHKMECIKRSVNTHIEQQQQLYNYNKLETYCLQNGLYKQKHLSVKKDEQRGKYIIDIIDGQQMEELKDYIKESFPLELDVPKNDKEKIQFMEDLASKLEEATELLNSFDKKKKEETKKQLIDEYNSLFETINQLKTAMKKKKLDDKQSEEKLMGLKIDELKLLVSTCKEDLKELKTVIFRDFVDCTLPVFDVDENLFMSLKKDFLDYIKNIDFHEDNNRGNWFTRIFSCRKCILNKIYQNLEDAINDKQQELINKRKEEEEKHNKKELSIINEEEDDKEEENSKQNEEESVKVIRYEGELPKGQNKKNVKEEEENSKQNEEDIKEEYSQQNSINNDIQEDDKKEEEFVVDKTPLNFKLRYSYQDEMKKTTDKFERINNIESLYGKVEQIIDNMSGKDIKEMLRNVQATMGACCNWIC